MKKKEIKRIIYILLGVFFLTTLVPVSFAGIRVIGKVGTQLYGYQDSNSEDHLWLRESARFSLYQTGTPWSLHASGSYLGDNYDDFSYSGQGRFLKGFVRYGDLSTKLNARVGRFFLFNGVANGVIDGGDFRYRYNKNLSFSAFAGLMGPYNRQFEFSEPDKSFSFGTRVDISPKKCLIADEGKMAVSYTRQSREEGVIRHLIGVNTLHRWGKSLSLLNTFHFKPAGDPIRKLVSRLRYNTTVWHSLFEAGLIKPDVAYYSWFSDFSLPASVRLRLVVDRYLVEDKWGLGIEGATLIAEGKTGFRGGPVVNTPYGQVGYRMSSGDYAISSGPWASLRAQVIDGLEVYGYGSYVSYEWDAYDIDSEDLTLIHAGMRFTPKQFKSISLNGEFQVYKTPQYDEDRRALGGISWRFDYGRGK